MSGLKLLFLSTKATRPSHRFRVEQMLPELAERGHQCTVKFFPKNPLARLWFYRQLPQFDAVFIQQRTIDPIELKLVRRLAARLIFDVDDAVMFDGQGQSDPRRARRFAAMVRGADLVLCGNHYLHEHVVAATVGTDRNIAIEILPTAIDTDRFHPDLRPPGRTKPIVIGWTGSRSTNSYLNMVFPVLADLPAGIELKIISDSTVGFDFSRLGNMPHTFVPWSAEHEALETAEFDIGLMPLPDDNSTRGKCGCKALQYMALGIPAVCSPVGVNCDIIRDQHNGFLPITADEWSSTLRRLVADSAWSKQIGQAGRTTVEMLYSRRKIALRLAMLIENVVSNQRTAA